MSFFDTCSVWTYGRKDKRNGGWELNGGQERKCRREMAYVYLKRYDVAWVESFSFHQRRSSMRVTAIQWAFQWHTGSLDKRSGKYKPCTYYALVEGRQRGSHRRKPATLDRVRRHNGKSEYKTRCGRLWGLLEHSVGSESKSHSFSVQELPESQNFLNKLFFFFNLYGLSLPVLKGYYSDVLLKWKGMEEELRCLAWDIIILSFSESS